MLRFPAFYCSWRQQTNITRTLWLTIISVIEVHIEMFHLFHGVKIGPRECWSQVSWGGAPPVFVSILISSCPDLWTIMIDWNKYFKSRRPVAIRTMYLFFFQCAPLSLVYRGVHPADPLLLEPVHVVRQRVARLGVYHHPINKNITSQDRWSKSAWITSSKAGSAQYRNQNQY